MCFFGGTAVKNGLANRLLVCYTIVVSNSFWGVRDAVSAVLTNTYTANLPPASVRGLSASVGGVFCCENPGHKKRAGRSGECQQS